MLKFILDTFKGAMRDCFDLDLAYNQTREGAPLMSVSPPLRRQARNTRRVSEEVVERRGKYTIAIYYDNISEESEKKT